MKLEVTYDDGEPKHIIAKPSGIPKSFPEFHMQGSTAVFLGGCDEATSKTARGEVEKLPFVQAIQMNP